MFVWSCDWETMPGQFMFDSNVDRDQGRVHSHGCICGRGGGEYCDGPCNKGIW